MLKETIGNIEGKNWKVCRPLCAGISLSSFDVGCVRWYQATRQTTSAICRCPAKSDADGHNRRAVCTRNAASCL
eukprot:1883153-Rhodomonas_salina.2